jgi:uncharacterized integral membrane protein
MLNSTDLFAIVILLFVLTGTLIALIVGNHALSNDNKNLRRTIKILKDAQKVSK